jgi:hypothetical protein
VRLTRVRRECAVSRENFRDKIGAGEGNRTLVFSLEGCCSTIELHPRSFSLPYPGAGNTGQPLARQQIYKANRATVKIPRGVSLILSQVGTPSNTRPQYSAATPCSSQPPSGSITSARKPSGYVQATSTSPSSLTSRCRSWRISRPGGSGHSWLGSAACFGLSDAADSSKLPRLGVCLDRSACRSPYCRRLVIAYSMTSGRRRQSTAFTVPSTIANA